MSSTLLMDAGLYGLLKKCDEDLAATMKGTRCRHCGGALHSARYRRKPRAVPDEVEREVHWRMSFCCAADLCRRRATPPSLRFLGRRVYVSTAVVLISAMRCGATPTRIQRLRELVGVSRRTVLRWQRWWRHTLPHTPFWRGASAVLHEPVDTADLPQSLLDRFEGDPPQRLQALLRFIAPLTGHTGV
jgi:hypothetical protein